MSKGRNNKLAGQIGEFLVCAELGRRRFIATPFSGNVPAFDVLVADERCRTVPIQVKASQAKKWPNNVRDWMEITFDEETERQNYLGPKKIENRDLIYVFVAIASSSVEADKDRFFILTKAQLQKVIIKSYGGAMEKKGWKHPRSTESYLWRISIAELEKFENEKFEDNWKLIANRLATAG
jgi:hypothetical protein